MKNLTLIILLIFTLFVSCSEETPDITGTYKIISISTSCDNPDQNTSFVEGENEFMGTTVNFSGNMLFTFGNVFEADYLLEAEFTSEQVFIAGTYTLSNEEFVVCGNNSCLDNAVPTGGNQITIMVEEGCLITLVGERN